MQSMQGLKLQDLRTGAAQPQLTIAGISHVKTIIPSKPILQHYNEFVDPLFSQTDVLRKQVALLAEARDLLLPRLMSGEIAV
jgi:type I restriction enzyme S subunit